MDKLSAGLLFFVFRDLDLFLRPGVCSELHGVFRNLAGTKPWLF